MRTCVSAPMPEAPHIVVTIHHPGHPPTDEEWNESLDMLLEANKLPTEHLAQLVFTNGSGPNAKQRSRVAPARQSVKKRFVCAVVSSSPLARGTITALAWIGVKGLQAYAPHRIDEALAYVGYTGSKESLKRLVADMVKDMEGGPRASLLALL